MRAATTLVAFLLLLVSFSCAGDEPPPAPPDLPPPAFPAEEPAETTLSCPIYSGDHAFPEMAPLESAPAARIGAIDGAFSVSSGGSAAYSIAFEIPPGRQIEPSVGISYDSGTDVGLLGKGFSLYGLSSITRCGSNLAQDGAVRGVALDDGDHYCLDGMRLVEVGRGKDAIGSFAEYRTFPDTQTKILGYGAPTANAFGPTYFIAWRHDGRIVEYGKSSDRRLVWRGGVVRVWNIEREMDRRGNTVRYWYESDIDQPSGSGATREMVPSRIEYTGHVDQAGQESPGVNSIVFRYTSFDHDGPMFAEGELASHDRLLMAVDIVHRGHIVRTYGFTYGFDSTTRRRLLVQVDECAAGDDAQCRPPTIFGWSDAPHGGFEPHSLPPEVPSKSGDPQYAWTLADVTGDGRPDLVTSTTHPDTGRNRWFVYANAGGGTFLPPVQWADMDYPQGFSKQWNISPLDFDADGRIDLLIDQPMGTGWNHYHVLVSRPTPTPHFELVATKVPRNSQWRASEFTIDSHSAYTLADLDADGMLDFVSCQDLRTWYGLAEYVPDNCDGFNDCKPSLARWRAHLWRPGVGFEAADHPLDALDGLSCWTMKRLFGAVDWDADGQTELVGVGKDGTWWTHRLDASTLQWESRSIGLPLLNVFGLSLADDPVAQMLVYPLTLSKAEKMEADWHALRAMFPDVNADGYPDLLYVGPIGTNMIPYVVANEGRDALQSFNHSYDVDPPGAASTFFYSPYARVFDYDNDARDDLVIPVEGTCDDGDSTCYVVFRSEKLGESATPIVTPIHFENPDGNTVAPQYVLRTIDVDGDRVTDVVFPKLEAQMVAFMNRAPRDLLTSITTGRNPLDSGDSGFLPDVSVEYGELFPSETYEPRADPANGCEYPRACVVGAFPVVSAYRLNDGKNQPRTFSLHYSDGRAHRHGRGFLGFAEVSTRDVETGAVSEDHFDNLTFDETFRTFPLAGMVVASKTTSPAGPNDPDPMRIDTTSLRFEREVHPTNGGATHFMATRSTEKVRAQNGDVLERTWSLVDEIDDDANVLHSRSFTDGVDLLEETKRVVVNDHTWWLLGLEQHVEMCSTSLGETKCRELANEYNARGEVWRSTRAPGDTDARRVVRSVRDEYGNVIHVLADDDFGHHREACVTFEPTGTYPWAMKNGAGHLSHWLFDQALGAMVSFRDPNGRVAKRRLDGFGRVLEERSPEGVITTSSAERVKDAVWQTRIVESTEGRGTLELVLDSFGRVVRERIQGPDVPAVGISVFGPGKWFVREVEYDHFGRPVRESSPHIEGDAPAALIAETRQFDTAGRLWKTKKPWGAVIATLEDHDVVTTTEPGPGNMGPVTTRTERDALGRVKNIVDAKNGVTTYTYGPFGELRSAVSPDGTKRETIRDALGRVVLEIDPDRGKTIAFFDGFDQTRKFRDAAGREYSFSYDALGRRTWREQGGEVTTYEYDTATHGLGLLARVTGADGHAEEYAYDGYSRPWQTTLRLGDGRALESRRYYDTASRLKEIIYPAANGKQPFRVVREYDGAGTLVRVLDGDTRRPLWQLDMVDGAGRTMREVFGNGVATEWHHDPVTGVLEHIYTESGTKTLQSLVYRYDSRLNPSERKDERQGKVERFRHDELDRLTCARVDTCDPMGPCLDWGGPCETWIDYGPAGDISFKSDVGKYAYDPAHPHAVVAAGAAGFANDAVGNQIARPGMMIKYTDFDLPREYVPTAGGTPTKFEYDGLGQRVRKLRGEAETVYFGDLYERDSSGVERHYVSNGERVVSIFERGPGGNAFRYVHVDHLGSVDVVTDDGGQEIDRRSFDVFGMPRDPNWGGAAAAQSGATSRGYTWHEWDAEAELVNAKGRIYDPRIGRFLQTDPIVANVFSGQAWDPYSYVMNKPLAATDPSGYQLITGPVANPTVIEVVVHGKPREQKEVKLFELQKGIAAAARVRLPEKAPEPPPAAAADSPMPEQSFKEKPAVQVAGGIVAGAIIGTVPGGSVVAKTVIDSGAVAKGTEEARIGKGVGEIASGLVQMFFGGLGMAGGGGVSVTGGGAAVGVPVAVASMALAMNGYGAVVMGVGEIGRALSTGGGGQGTPAQAKGPRVVNSKMGHAAQRATERAGFADTKSATKALQDFGANIERDGIPEGAVTDAAGHLVIPGFGDGGAVVYRFGKDGKLILQTVLEWVPGKGIPYTP